MPVTAARTLLLAAVASLVAGLLGGCSRGSVTSLAGSVKPGQAAGYNVVLVTIDTARRDHFGCYGHAEARTPTIDALAHDGVLCDDAVTSVPLTLPSHTTLLTGLYPPHHGVHDNGISQLGTEPPLLQAELRDHGYATAAFVGAFVLDERFGLARGFDHYDFEVTDEGYHPQMTEFNERSAGAVTDSALAWLDRHHAQAPSQPFFTWLHYFDAHHPYTSPLASLPEFAGKPYDAEIAYVDQQFQRVVGWLIRQGLRDRTIIVVTADHGESLGEHGESTHGMFIYDSTLRVPLVISCPSLISGPLRLRDVTVGLVDIRPTIDDLLGITPTGVHDGRSFLADLPPDRAIYIETEGPRRMARCSPLRGLRSHVAKFIEAPEPEYYDLAQDAAELHNLYSTSAAAVAPLRDELASVLSSGTTSPQAEHEITEEERSRLRSLGYTFTAALGDTASLPDPKWQIEYFNEGMEAEQLYAQGDYAAAADLARKVVRGCGGCMNAQRVLAFSELRLGNDDEAIAMLHDDVKKNPDAFLVRSLVQALILTKDYPAALDVIGTYDSLYPRDGWFPLLRGDCQSAQGDYDDALKNYERAMRIDAARCGRRASARIEATREKLNDLGSPH